MKSVFPGNSIYDDIDIALKKSQSGDYHDAAKILEKVILSVQKDKKPRLYARIILELGDCYCNLPESSQFQSNIDLSTRYYCEAISYYTRKTDPYAYAMISNNLGNIYSYLFDKSRDTDKLQTAIAYYNQALDVFTYEANIFSTYDNYETGGVTRYKNEDYVYFYALIRFNHSKALKKQVEAANHMKDEYISGINSAISLFNDVINTGNLHQSNYLNAWYNLGECYVMLYELTDEPSNLDNSVRAYENGLKYYYTNKKFKEMYPGYRNAVVGQIRSTRQKAGEDINDKDYSEYENIQPVSDVVCENCGNVNVVEGYNVPLCTRCRRVYTKYPVPKWIKVFATVVSGVFIFSMLRFPGALKVTVDYERGMRADNEKKCQTALKYLKRAQSKYPDSFLINSRVFIDLAKCSNYEEAAKLYNAKIAGREVTDSTLYYTINEMNKKVFMPEEGYSEIKEILETSKNYSMEDLIKKLKEYNTRYPKNVEGLSRLSSLLFEQGKFEEARELDLKAISLQPYRDDIRLSLAAVYRQTGELDKSMKECEYILENVNSENAIAIGSISRLYIKQHKFKEALDYAKRAFELDSEMYYNLETIAMAYHFNNMLKERDSIYEKIKNISYDEATKKSDLEFLQDVFNGKSELYN